MLRMNPFAQIPASEFQPDPKPVRPFLHDWRFSAFSLLCGAVLLIVFSTWARSDDLTGLAQDDPKDLAPTPAPVTTARNPSTGLFVPMPDWARNVVLSPLPGELRPMGGKTKVTVTTPAPPPLAPPKDAATPAATTASAAAPVMAKPAENPAMITVSPFLQWIKSNPQVAAAQAKQAADSYRTGTASPASPANAATSASNPNNPPSVSQDNYWLPPLIDSPEVGAPVVVGSAAIYSTPQR